MTDYSKLRNVGGTIYEGERGFKDPTELAGHLGIGAHEIDWGQIQQGQSSFIKNPQYDPNDPGVKRYIPSGGGLAGLIKPPEAPQVDKTGAMAGYGAPEGIKAAFGEGWQPSEIFKQRGLIDQGITGAVQVGGSPDIFTIGQGGKWIESMDEYEKLFGTRETQGIVGQITPEQAKLLGIRPEGVAELKAGRQKETDMKELFDLAQQAGLSWEEATNLVNSQYPADTAGIREDLGIPDVVGKLFEMPDKTTQEIYQEAYDESELPGVKDKIKNIDDKIAKREADLVKATGEINQNPWLSQASRTGRLRILNELAFADIKNLENQRTSYLDLYDKGIDELEGVMTRGADQYERQRTLYADQLNYLLGEAERRADEAKEERMSEHLRFMPDFLKGMAEEGVKDKDWDKWLTPTEAEKLGVPYGTTRGEATKIADIYEGLSTSQQLQAGNMAVKIFGKRAGMKPENIKKVTSLMREGMSIDNIEDMLKYAGQSEKFSGDIRDAAESIASNYTSDVKRQQLFDSLDRSLESGDIGRVLTLLKKSAVDSLGVDDAKVVRGKARTVEFLEEIREDLNEYERKGGNTNIFSGTAEDIAKKIGTVKDANLRRISTKIMTAIQSYRRSMSGVAFSVPESKEYQAMFPSIGQTKDFNMANIDALQEVFNGDLEFTYKFLMGDAYDSIFKEGSLDISTSQGLESLWGEEGGTGDLFDFSGVGGDTNSASLSKEGSKGGQCGSYVRKVTGLRVGDSYASKMAKMDKSIKKAEPGMIFVIPYKKTGHIGIILSIKNGIATVRDSNWKLDEKIRTHKIAVSKMTGFAHYNRLT